MKPPRHSMTAFIIVLTLLTSCAIPNGSGPLSQGNPCAPTQEPSFMQQGVINPLMRVGGSLLAAAATNYTQLYAGKLNTLLTNLVTPKEHRRSESHEGENAGFELEESVDQDDSDSSEKIFIEEEFENEIQTRGMPGEYPHAVFPSEDPCSEVEEVEYEEIAPSSLGLEVVLVQKTLRNGVPLVMPIQDGDVLKDGRGDPQAGDKFRVLFRPTTDSYVYVIAIDGSGWAQGIFPPPTSPLANPVKAEEQHVLPEGNNWFSLDQFRGIETLFFLASLNQREDIEEILQNISGQERPATANPQQVTKVAKVPYGVGAIRPSNKPFGIASGPGQNQNILPTSYFAGKAGEDLRLTRWFRHQ